ncbi:MAG: hypothetical protein MI749_06315 [Desulfovibrionales bacterium]|nr:hypothetical protein [Desulfovibrionales bacterium]
MMNELLMVNVARDLKNENHLEIEIAPVLKEMGAVLTATALPAADTLNFLAMMKKESSDQNVALKMIPVQAVLKEGVMMTDSVGTTVLPAMRRAVTVALNHKSAVRTQNVHLAETSRCAAMLLRKSQAPLFQQSRSH